MNITSASNAASSGFSFGSGRPRALYSPTNWIGVGAWDAQYLWAARTACNLGSRMPASSSRRSANSERASLSGATAEAGATAEDDATAGVGATADADAEAGAPSADATEEVDAPPSAICSTAAIAEADAPCADTTAGGDAPTGVGATMDVDGPLAGKVAAAPGAVTTDDVAIVEGLGTRLLNSAWDSAPPLARVAN